MDLLWEEAAKYIGEKTGTRAPSRTTLYRWRMEGMRPHGARKKYFLRAHTDWIGHVRYKPAVLKSWVALLGGEPTRGETDTTSAKSPGELGRANPGEAVGVGKVTR